MPDVEFIDKPTEITDSCRCRFDLACRTLDDQEFSADPLQFLHAACHICIHGSHVMNEDMGGLIWLPSMAPAPDPDQFLGEALEGWKRQQLALNLGLSTIQRRSRSMIRMTSFIGKAPWEWLPGDADDLLSHLRSVQNLSHNTIRAYQTDVKLFLDFTGDGAYDWNSRCAQLFGTVFSQVLSELNRATHAQETGEASKRPFSIPELQEFFHLADLEPERVLNSGRKGPILRRIGHASRSTRQGQQGFGAEITDHADCLRLGPEMLEHWDRVGCPRFGLQRTTPLFPTDTGKMVDQAYLPRRFHALIEGLGYRVDCFSMQGMPIRTSTMLLRSYLSRKIFRVVALSRSTS